MLCHLVSIFAKFSSIAACSDYVVICMGVYILHLRTKAFKLKDYIQENLLSHRVKAVSLDISASFKESIGS